MRIPWLTAASLAPLLLTPAPTFACSMSQFAALLNDSDAFFTGTATADTLLAGPGMVRYRERTDQPGQESAPSVYGQVVRVDRIAGRAAEQLPVDVSEVVVVPWGVDPACRPTLWSLSAQWVTPGTSGLYVATLRAPEHWVDGRPTVDVRNTGEIPYTANAARMREMGPGASAASLLSPAQLFEVYRALPTISEIETRGPAVLTPLREWAREHPDLATRPPARLLLGVVTGYLASRQVQAELRRSDHPVLGTWRFTLRLPEGTSRVFFARTGAHPTSRRSRMLPETDETLELRVSPAEGYSFLAATARTLEELPRTPEQSRRHGSGYLYSSAHMDSIDDESIGWRGYVEVGLLREVLFGDPRLRDAIEEAFRRGVYRLQDGIPVETPDRFTRGADGLLRVTHSFPLSGGEILLLEGEQVSREVIVAQ